MVQHLERKIVRAGGYLVLHELLHNVVPGHRIVDELLVDNGVLASIESGWQEEILGDLYFAVVVVQFLEVPEAGLCGQSKTSVLGLHMQGIEADAVLHWERELL